LKKKILVVDDDPTTRFMMTEFLDALGYPHVVVANGCECLATLVTDPDGFDLILMDIHMPYITGLDSTTWIRGLEIDPPRSIPIIALTADTRYHNIADLLPFGMSDVLSKPVSMDQLDAKLSSVPA